LALAELLPNYDWFKELLIFKFIRNG
jgi:hypothetical protein